MNKVLAALDNSLAGTAVVATAQALAELFAAEIEAVHVPTNGDRSARGTAEAAGVPLRTLSGPVVEALVEAGEAPDVVALVVGARGTPAGRRPLGRTAAAVATALRKPIVVVPPDAAVAGAFRRILVPLEGSLSASLSPAWIAEVAPGRTVDAVALHIHEEKSIPAFTDQPQHEHAAWSREFLRRYLPSGLGAVRLETRVGHTAELVPRVAEEHDCDLIVLGWSQELSTGRAPVVRGTLERSRLPVALVPVQPVTKLEDAIAIPPARTVERSSATSSRS
ncbi:MAG TPA: universal stress protein [Gaiellaceae bacterium]|nr:universal stress protein [Gaiellaceae bacterium]